MIIELDKGELDQIAALREMNDSKDYKHTEFAALAVHFAAMMMGHVRAVESQEDYITKIVDEDYYNRFGERCAANKIKAEKTL